MAARAEDVSRERKREEVSRERKREDVSRERKRVEEARDILTEAVRAARRVVYGSSRAKAFAFIAEAQAKAGDARGAAQSFSDARAAARGADKFSRASAFAFIAGAQAKAGDIQGARAAARGVESGLWRASAFATIAEAQAKAGDARGAAQSLSDARATARGVADEDDRARAYLPIAWAQAKVGDIQDALATARGMADESSRAKAFAFIAEAQAKAGDARGAAQSFSDARAARAGGWNPDSFAPMRLPPSPRRRPRSGTHAMRRSRSPTPGPPREGWNRNPFAAWRLPSSPWRRPRPGTFKAPWRPRGGGESESWRAAIAEAQAKAGDIQGALATARGGGIRILARHGVCHHRRGVGNAGE